MFLERIKTKIKCIIINKKNISCLYKYICQLIFIYLFLNLQSQLWFVMKFDTENFYDIFF